MQVSYARFVPSLQKDRTPDAAGNEPRSPIPAILIRRFASVRTRFLALIISGRKFVIHLCHDGQNFINRRTEAYSECVRTRFRKTFCVRAPGPKHVVGTNQGFVVEEHVGIGIQAFKDQLQICLLKHLTCDVECSLIFPIGLAYPLQLFFVVAIEGIFDQLVIKEVSVYAPGDARGVPSIFAGLAKLPTRQ